MMDLLVASAACVLAMAAIGFIAVSNRRFRGALAEFDERADRDAGRVATSLDQLAADQEARESKLANALGNRVDTVQAQAMAAIDDLKEQSREDRVTVIDEVRGLLANQLESLRSDLVAMLADENLAEELIREAARYHGVDLPTKHQTPAD